VAEFRLTLEDILGCGQDDAAWLQCGLSVKLGGPGVGFLFPASVMQRSTSPPTVKKLLLLRPLGSLWRGSGALSVHVYTTVCVCGGG